MPSPATFASGVPSAAETTATAGQKCRWGKAVLRAWQESPQVTGADPLDGFSPATRAWFDGAFAEPTQAQAGAWRAIGKGEDTLVVAPTGSGKTLAAFLWAIDRLAAVPPPADPKRRTRVLYVSPLKALAVDIERNLRAPLTGITARRAPAGPGRAGHQGGGAHRRHRRRGAQEAGQPSRRTSSSPPRSRCSCCSPRRPGRPCAGSRPSSWTRCTRSRATSAAPTWPCPWSGWTRCGRGQGSAPPSGSGCPRRCGRWRRWPRSSAAPGGHRGAAAQPQAHRAAGRRPGRGHDRAGRAAGPRRRGDEEGPRPGARSGRTSRSGCST